MKKFIASLLAISIISGVFHLDELTRIPTLYSHYHQYVERGNEGSLVDFLVSHYLSDGSDATEHGEHEKLPFKSQKGLQAHISVFDDSGNTEFRFFMSYLPLLYPETVPGLSYCEVKNFQPPRFV